MHSVFAAKPALYCDTSASLAALHFVGKFLEASANQRASEGIGGLNRMLPGKARILVSGAERLVSCEKQERADGKTITYFGLEGMGSTGVYVFGGRLKEGGALQVLIEILIPWREPQSP